MAINFTYGDYVFNPRPLLTISSEPLKTPDGVGYGINHTISLQGDLILTGATEIDSGIVGVFTEIENLKEALSQDGRLLVVDCNNTGILSGYPTIQSFNFNNVSDNYTRRAQYNIDFLMPTLQGGGTGVDDFNANIFPPFIESCSENWDVEFADERIPFDWVLNDGTVEKFGYTVAVTHTVDVKARLAYTGDSVSNTPWEDAKNYASGKLGFDNEFFTLTGVLGLPGYGYFSTYDTFNNLRQVSTNKSEGSINITETFLVTPSGTDSLPNNAVETFDISTSQSEGNVTVSINGEIQGLANIDYTGDGGSNEGFYIISDKFTAASGYYNIIKSRMFDRANTAYSGVVDTGNCFYRNLNPIVRSRTVGINPIQGTITYSYDFDTQQNCITGDCIISQNITIDDNLATDIFASQVILGRAAGPILQDIGTITAKTRNVNIELVTLPPTDCTNITGIYEPIPTGEIENFISIVSGDLSANYSQVFVSSNSQNWNFTIGRYSRSVGFTYNDCN